MSKKSNFYKSEAWRNFRLIRIAENTSANNGILTCDYCHKPIVDTTACHIHHITELTEDNVSDPTIALSSKNTMCLHHECHNSVHHRYIGTPSRDLRKVFLVYGAPCSGKEEYVKSHCGDGDLVISIDRITECISATGKPSPEIDPIIFKVRATLLESVRRRIGRWKTAWIIDSAPSKARRSELCRQYRADPIYIESTEEECLKKRKADGRPEAVDTYIRQWFKDYKE